MRPPYEDLDEFDLDFADSATARQILHEKLREQRRLASRRASGPDKKRKRDDYEDDEFDNDYDEYDDYDDDDGSDSYLESSWD